MGGKLIISEPKTKAASRAIIGDGSSVTTLNTYAYITHEMRQKTALNIDQGIAGAERIGNTAL